MKGFREFLLRGNLVDMAVDDEAVPALPQPDPIGATKCAFCTADV